MDLYGNILFCENHEILFLNVLTYRMKQWAWYKQEIPVFTKGSDPKLNSNIYSILNRFYISIWTSRLVCENVYTR